MESAYSRWPAAHCNAGDRVRNDCYRSISNDSELIPPQHPLAAFAAFYERQKFIDFLPSLVRFENNDEEQGTFFVHGIHNNVYAQGHVAVAFARRFLIQTRKEVPRYDNITRLGIYTPHYYSEYKYAVRHVEQPPQMRNGLCRITTSEGITYIVLLDTGHIIADVQNGVPDFWQAILSCNEQGDAVDVPRDLRTATALGPATYDTQLPESAPGPG